MILEEGWTLPHTFCHNSKDKSLFFEINHESDLSLFKHPLIGTLIYCNENSMVYKYTKQRKWTQSLITPIE